MIEAAIDFAAAPDAPAFDIGNFIAAQRHRLPAVPVFLQHLVSGKRFAGFQWIEWPFLDQQHIPSRLGEQAGGDCTARTRADDRNLAAEFLAGGYDARPWRALLDFR